MLKTFSGVEFKDEAQGLVTSKISTFGVIDSDGDVTSKSSFVDGQPVIMSAYNHQSWKGALPIGHGKVFTNSTEAIFEGQFLMNTTHGSDAFHTVKALSDVQLQEWSYSLRGIKSSQILVEGRKARHLDSFDVNEVSPVIKGASVDTRTLDIKQFGDDGVPTDMKFAEHSEWVVAQVEAFIKRAQEVTDLRADKGKSISEESKAQIMALREQLEKLLADPQHDPDLDDEVLKAFLRSQNNFARS